MNKILPRNKLLIIDEKLEYRDDGTGIQFYKNLPENLKSKLEICTEVTLKLVTQNENEVEILFDVNEFLWVFYHDSYKDKSLESSQLEDFKGKVENLIVFSGGKEEVGFEIKSTTRKLLFERLQKAMKVWQDNGVFPVKYLCERNIGPYYHLLEVLDDYLMDDDKEGFINANELKLVLQKLNYTASDIEKKIIPYYKTLPANDLAEKIDEWKFKQL